MALVLALRRDMKPVIVRKAYKLLCASIVEVYVTFRGCDFRDAILQVPTMAIQASCFRVFDPRAD